VQKMGFESLMNEFYNVLLKLKLKLKLCVLCAYS
jgi:hypothetical protein